MRLGNSKGQNKGKKYLRKDEIDVVFAVKAEHFNKWFSENYKTLTLYLIDKDIFDNDVFNLTYINIHDNILFAGLECSDKYKGYLMRAYYTNYINNKSLSTEREYRFCELLDNVDIEDREYSEIVDIDEKRTNLEQDIFKYVYSKYSLRNFELFKMYMHLKPAVNYSTLESITGVKAYLIQRIVSKIKKDIQQNKEFQKRRKEVL